MVCCSCYLWLPVLAIIAYQLYKRFSRLPITPGCFKGKVVVVTGASSGIGEELAIQYGKLGASLVLSARRVDRLEALKTRIQETGDCKVVIVPTDVSVPGDCEKLIKETIKAFGKLDLLVLNAGVSGGNMTLEEFPDLSRHVYLMNTNYFGCVVPTYFALPHLRKTRGQIVAISSLAAYNPTAKRTAYAPTKAALNSFYDNLRLEMSNEVALTVVCPGYVATEIHDTIMQQQKLTRNLKVFMTSAECARLTIESGLNKDRLFIMTAAARIARYLRLVLPEALMDNLTQRASAGAFLHAD